MKQLFIRISILSIIVFSLLRITDFVFKEDHFFEKTISEHHKQEGIEVAIFGSSRAHSNFDPRIFETEMGVNTFNFGAPAQKFEATSVIAKNVLKKHKPKFAIIDIFSLSIGKYVKDETRKNQLATLNEAPLSFYKINKLREIFGTEKLLPSLFPSIRNHSDWLKLFQLPREPYLIGNGIDFYKGFRSYYKTINSESWLDFEKQYDGKNMKRPPIQLSDEEKEKIDEIIHIFQERDIEIIFVNSPTFVMEAESYFREYSKSIQSYIKAKGITFLELNNVKDSLKLNWNFYSDPNHLNANGARVISEYLCEHISTNFVVNKQSQADLNLDSNRYSHLKLGIESLPLYKKPGLELKTKYPFVEYISAYKTLPNRIEIIIEISIDKIENIPFKIEFEHRGKKTDSYTRNKGLKQEGLKTIYSSLTQGNVITYKNKYYLVFPFNCSESNTVKMFIGDKRDVEVLSLNYNQFIKS